MKIVSLLAGVAAVALTAGAASAQDINKGQAHIFGTDVNIQGGGFFADLAAAANRANANWGNSPVSSWHAYGNAANNNGTAAGSDGASFTMTGTVSTDCAYYSGNNNTETLDFGQIGIYASDNTGP
uniref:hypothetical protein n=1 Tax=Brevundimonas sp. TaxID=1871086 RepID=UPI002FCC6A1D